MKILIPARFGSSRFPGKPLAMISGVSMIRRVVERALSFGEVVVLTDDERIAEEARWAGGEAMLTPASCQNGTERICSVLGHFLREDFLINVQGDEPLFSIEALEGVVREMRGGSYAVASAHCPMSEEEAIRNTTAKVVLNFRGELAYMSRGMVGSKNGEFTKGIGIYGFTPWALAQYHTFGRRELEAGEDIEILRFLDLGIPVKMVKANEYSPSVDVPPDIALVESLL